LCENRIKYPFQQNVTCVDYIVVYYKKLHLSHLKYLTYDLLEEYFIFFVQN